MFNFLSSLLMFLITCKTEQNKMVTFPIYSAGASTSKCILNFIFHLSLGYEPFLLQEGRKLQ